MHLFRKITTWYQGLGNVSSAIPLDLGCTYSPAATKSSTAVKLCIFWQNHRLPILGSPMDSAKSRSNTSILNPLISECYPVKFTTN